MTNPARDLDSLDNCLDNYAVRAGFVLLAGGMGSRMGSGINKVYLQIGDRNIIEFALATALTSPLVAQLVLVVRPDDVELVEQLNLDLDRVRVVHGGPSRHQSEYNGIKALRQEIDGGAVNVVAVHDGARPFMTAELLNRALTQAAATGAALPACPVNDKMYMLDSETFVDSSDYAWVQTPQVFSAQTLIEAHDRAAAAGFEGVDTAEVVQRFSEQPINLVAGDRANIKVTYQQDLSSAETTASGWPQAD